MQFAVAIYERFVLDQPRLTLVAVVVIVGFFAFFARDFKLDASADSLLLERDTDLRYYRGIRARYGSDDYLVITYKTKADLFAPETLADIKQLRDELAALESLTTVTTMLDVPLISSPPTTLQELQKEVPNLLSPRTDIELARQELTGSALYRELIMSLDGHTTALLAVFRKNPVYLDLLHQRDAIHERQLIADLSEDDQQTLKMLDDRIGIERARLTDRQQIEIDTIRKILDRHRGAAEIRLGGLPMIVTDMLDFIRHDVLVFGIGILVFLIGLLFVFFVRARWVVLSMLCCFMSVITMVGYLGLTR
jgi:predicted RND superfamily exporter protein